MLWDHSGRCWGEREGWGCMVGPAGSLTSDLVADTRVATFRGS